MKIDSRWIALIILCFGGLMIVVDTSIVNIALPIKTTAARSRRCRSIS